MTNPKKLHYYLKHALYLQGAVLHRDTWRAWQIENLLEILQDMRSDDSPYDYNGVVNHVEGLLVQLIKAHRKMAAMEDDVFDPDNETIISRDELERLLEYERIILLEGSISDDV